MKTWYQKELEQFSMINGNKVYAIPDAKTLRSFRVVVATCVSAAVPHSLGIERGWFTHVFLDEAGQCSEPDSMIPLNLIANEATNVVLAGDFKATRPGCAFEYQPRSRPQGQLYAASDEYANL